MRVACPKCGAPTEILPDDHGKQIKCYDCLSMLAVDRNGHVSLAETAPPPPRMSQPYKRSEPMAD